MTLEEKFDEAGFKNQAIIKGFKRIELKQFIRKEIEDALDKTKNWWTVSGCETLDFQDGYNQAIQEFNDKINQIKKEL